MKLSLRLYGHLSWYYNKAPGRFEAEIPGNPTLMEILGIFNVPGDEVSIASVNGKRAGLDFNPSEGDHIEFFPVVSGG